MKHQNKQIGKSKFILQNGASFTYADLEIELSLSEKQNAKISVSEVDKSLKRQIMSKMEKWVNHYAQDEIYIDANLIRISFMNGNLDINRGITLAFHDGLPKIGVNPPQIFTE